jgi:hypothetical protein
MKQNKKELDVDFIGGQTGLTEQEEKAISAYLQSSKKGISKESSTPKRRTRLRSATKTKV